MMFAGRGHNLPAMIERLLPGTVATAETREDVIEVELFAEERRTLGRAVEKRRREFVTGRACARLALGKLGIEPSAIPGGERGEPLWPERIVGSITHCAGYRAAAVAWRDDIAAIGIDAEEDARLPVGVLEEVAFGPELALARTDGPAHMDRLLFSAKEAVYKAWFPLAGRWLGFDDVELGVDVGGGKFRARLLVPGPMLDGRRLTEFAGCWVVEDGVICSAVVVAGPGPSRARTDQ